MSAAMAEGEYFQETSHANGTTTWVVQGNALDLPLPEECVDLVVTSPPYFGLRSYQDGGEHYDGQIGAEATPAEFVDALIAATREMMRVVKPSGSIWVNLGDKYVADNRGSAGDVKRGAAKYAPAGPAGYPGEGIMPRKSLMLIPQRYAIRCVDELGLILRAEVIWSKPNGLPESVTDRVRRSHEQWFHFTKEPRYYSAVDEIREAHVMKPQRRMTASVDDVVRPEGARTLEGVKAVRDEPGVDGNPLGKLPGSVWTIPTEPLRVPEELGIDHFAAFPTEFPRRIITGWSPRGVCVECGTGRRPVSESERTPRPTSGPLRGGANRTTRDGHPGTNGDAGNMMTLRTITGEACACPEPTAPTTPGVVLDPFGGTGTTALVASVLGRDAITVDLSRDYCRLSEWRVSDPKQRKSVETRNASCPRCDAQPGQRCTNGSGKTTTWHKERVSQ